MPIEPGSPWVMTIAVLLYLLFVNALTLLLFQIDAERAGAGERRVPERMFYLLSLAGGSLTAKLADRSQGLGTRSPGFRDTLNLLVAAQLAAVAILQTQKGQDMVINFGSSTVQIASLIVQQTGIGSHG